MSHLQIMSQAILEDVPVILKHLEDARMCGPAEGSSARCNIDDAMNLVKMWERRLTESLAREPIKPPEQGKTELEQIQLSMDTTLVDLNTTIDRVVKGDWSSVSSTHLQTIYKHIRIWRAKLDSLPVVEPEIWGFMVSQLGGLSAIRKEFATHQPMDVALNLQSEIAKSLRDRFNPEGNLEPREEMERIAEFLENQITLMIVAQEANLKGE
jgi:hypothetical protein